jgi:hypothetical protein
MSTVNPFANAAILSALDSFNDEYQNARASTGGAVRPPNGEWDNIVKGMDVRMGSGEDARINIAQKGSPDQFVDGLLVTFNYSMLGGASPVPPQWKAGQDWSGHTIALPLTGIKNLPASVAAGRRKAFEISLERLKGHLSTILGKASTGNLGADLQLAASYFVTGQPLVVCKVACDHSVDKKDSTRNYFDEYLKINLTPRS